MPISYVYTSGLLSPEMAQENILGRLGLSFRPEEYKLPRPVDNETLEGYCKRAKKLRPNSLLLGMNNEHNVATVLSDYPIVVLDDHTELYFHTPEDLEKVTFYNWVYWALKFGSQVHLVLPYVHEGDFYREEETLLIPDVFGSLYIYEIFKRSKSVNVFGQGKRVDALEDLYNRLKGKPKQVSLDLDICQGAEEEIIRSTIKTILENLSVDGNIYDFWLDNLSSREFEEALYFLNIIK